MLMCDMLLKPENIPNLKNGKILPPFVDGGKVFSSLEDEGVLTVTNGKTTWKYEVSHKDKTITFKYGASKRVVGWSGEVIESGVVEYHDAKHLCTKAQFVVMSLFSSTENYSDIDIWDEFENLFVENYHPSDRIPVRKNTSISRVLTSYERSLYGKKYRFFKDGGLNIIQFVNGLEYEVYKTKMGILSRVRNKNSHCWYPKSFEWEGSNNKNGWFFSRKNVSSFERFSELVGGLTEIEFKNLQAILCGKILISDEFLDIELDNIQRDCMVREMEMCKLAMEKELDGKEVFAYATIILDNDFQLKRWGKK